MKYLLYLILLIIHPVYSYTQDTAQETLLLQEIVKLQVKKDSFYYTGMFPTLRTNARNTNIIKDDNNIFFTALVAFTLQQIRNDLTPTQQRLCDIIIEKAHKSYSHFQNRKGKPTYNFWSTNPRIIFPNNWFLNLFNRSQALPDDIDDTVIAWLSKDANDSIVNIIHDLMIQHTNGIPKEAKNTFKSYKHITAYSTWLGNKMPIDFDFSVLCNVMYFLCDRKVAFNKYDSATINLIHAIIINDQHKSDPAYISPHYARTPILLYHIARLLGRFHIPILDALKPQLIKDSYAALKKCNNIFDSILLHTALIRLGASPKPLSNIFERSNKLVDNRNVFFMASFSSMMPNPFKKWFIPSKIIKFYYSCSAYNLALLLENVIEEKRYSFSTKKG